MITRLLDGLSRRRRRRPAPTVEGTDALVVEYAPRADGRPDPGEIVWTWVPYEDDPSQGKDRPVVVVGRSGDRLAGVALTSKDQGPDRERVAVGIGAWDPQHRPSWAKVDRLVIVDPERVRREGATLDRARFDAVARAVRELHPRVVIGGEDAVDTADRTKR